MELKITTLEGKQTGSEGCLSLPEFRVMPHKKCCQKTAGGQLGHNPRGYCTLEARRNERDQRE